ncbi:glycosyl hydrolase [Hypomontagnella submonticulosa]|nr:glycosyl hydrolase [Hypomontagnella submonticulosa]
MDAMPDVSPSWIDSGEGIWAPSVFKNDNGKYVIYYESSSSVLLTSTIILPGGIITTNHLGLRIAIADYAQEPFEDTSRPFTRNDAGGCIIDPVQFDDGKQCWMLYHLYRWSSYRRVQADSNSNLEVSRDGFTLQGNPKTILNHNGNADDGVVEGPAMWKRKPGSYVLFFSTHCYSSDRYDIQYAWGIAPDANFGHRKTLAASGPSQPIYGPGHMDIASDGTTISFHGGERPGNPKDTMRRMYIGRIKFPERDYTEGINVINY